MSTFYHIQATKPGQVAVDETHEKLEDLLEAVEAWLGEDWDLQVFRLEGEG